MNKKKLKICMNCVMDTSDNSIVFDHNGICDHCVDYYKNVKPNWHTDARGRQELEAIVKKIKKTSEGRDFDCIMGVSGGTDSSYLLHVIVKDFGLRPLVFHVDGGWNSDIAVHNINVMIDKLGLDLFTEVINWEEMKDFQLTFFKSGLPYLDIPQDHCFVASLYKFANKYKIKFILNGGNISTECVRNPLDWMYYGTDMALIKDLRNRYSTNPMKTYPFSNVLWHKVFLRYVKGVTVIKPLNYFPYIKSDAVKFLQHEYNWKPLAQKHYESRFTKFYEGYWLPKKFGYDTRKVQLSSLILTQQITRGEALEILKKPAISEEDVKHDFEYVANKLGITVKDLEYYLNQPNKSYKDYNNNKNMFLLGSKVLWWLGTERSIKR
jgi:N-acetyl sugar amidotransferase